nr:cytochrome c oxidase subunit II [Cladonia squamosa]
MPNPGNSSNTGNLPNPGNSSNTGNLPNTGNSSNSGFDDIRRQATDAFNSLRNDTPRPWGIYFQDSASPQMEGLVELHNNILFYLVVILFGVGWLLLIIVKKFTNTESPISYKYLGHGTLIELIWTISPALVLILIAFPSFKLLYLMDEVIDPAMAILAEGHQWYWSYQYPDFLNSDDEFIEFDSYLIPESDLEDGTLRMLEVDNRLILPEHTHIRIIITGADVIHSLACPALGLKCDAYPGRLNQTSVIISREGTFYGQCSEICGILHSSMPVVIESVSIEKFVSWLRQQ